MTFTYISIKSTVPPDDSKRPICKKNANIKIATKNCPVCIGYKFCIEFIYIIYVNFNLKCNGKV